jgi:hypothetical protein
VTFSFTLPADFPRLRVEPSGRYPAINWTSSAQPWTDDHVRIIPLS